MVAVSASFISFIFIFIYLFMLLVAEADYTVKGTRVATNLFLLSRVSLGALAPGALQ